jgi:ribosomal protein S18 acetylase RimI-like enzyme
MKPEIVLRKIEIDDLPKITAVHLDSFPESALTKLGAAIVERYYLWQLTGPHEKVRAVGAFVGNECAGFSFGGVFNGSTSGFIRQNQSFLIREVLLHPWLLSDPLFLKRVREGFQMLRRPRRKKAASAPPKIAPASFGILSIAVAENYQKLGIGQRLMLDAEREAARCAYKQMDLSVHPTNRKAVRFYEKLGWKKFPPGENWKGVMIKSLEVEKSAAGEESVQKILQV